MTQGPHGLPPPIDAKPNRSRRRRAIRIAVVAVVAVLCLIGALCIVVIVWAWRGVDQQDQAEAEGATFAAQATDALCLEETIRRVRATDSWLLLADAAFLRACLRGADASPGFCSGVPLPSDEEGGLQWRLERCEALQLELDDANCSSLYWPIQNYCVEQRASSEDAE